MTGAGDPHKVLDLGVYALFAAGQEELAHAGKDLPSISTRPMRDAIPA